MASPGIHTGGGFGSSPQSEQKLNSIRTKLHNSRLAQRFRRTKESIKDRAVEEITKRILPSSTPQPKPKRTPSLTIPIWDGRPARRSTERRSFIPDPSIPRPPSILKLRAYYGLLPPSSPPQCSAEPPRPTTPVTVLSPELELRPDLVPGSFLSPPVLPLPASPPPFVAAPSPPVATSPPVAAPLPPPTRSISPTTERITAWLSNLPPTPTPPPTTPPLRHRSSRSSRHARTPPFCSTATEVVLSRNNSTAGNTAATTAPSSHFARLTDAALISLSRPALHLQSSYHRFLFPIIWLVFDLLRATLQFFSSDAASLLPLLSIGFVCFGTFLAVDYCIWLVVFWVWFFSQLVLWGSLLGFGASVYFCGIGPTLEFLLPWVKWGLMINEYMNETSEPVREPDSRGRKPSYRAWWEAGQGIRNCSIRL